jgi:hypothetical protein
VVTGGNVLAPAAEEANMNIEMMRIIAGVIGGEELHVRSMPN